jgi:hemolysin III
VRLPPTDLGKPRMRGWLHTYGFAVALVAGAVLSGVAATRPGRAVLLSCVLYSASVAAMFGVSALYHRRVWSRRGFALMRRLDHAMIFMLIAGTYTPLCVRLLPADRANVILGVIWGGAITGAVVQLVWPHAPRWVSAPLYVALGWIAVVVLPDLLRGGRGRAGAAPARRGDVHGRRRLLRPALADGLAPRLRPPRVLPRRHPAGGPGPPHRHLPRPTPSRLALYA